MKLCVWYRSVSMLREKCYQLFGSHLGKRKKKKMNIYVGQLPFDVSEDEVRELFATFGQISSVTLIKDKFTGQMRGFGFVEMPDSGEAQKAIDGLNGKSFKNRSLVVNPARPREERSDHSGGGGGGRGGYSSDRRGGGGGAGGGGSRRRNSW
jgi:cold-inducible RNA-binding protein